MAFVLWQTTWNDKARDTSNKVRRNARYDGL